MKRLVILGAGGHGASCLEVAEEMGTYEILGFLDRSWVPGAVYAGYPILGNDALVASLVSDGVVFHLGVGSLTNTEIRRRLDSAVRSSGGHFVTLVSPRAFVSTRAVIGDGTVVMPFCRVGSMASIGRQVILNTGAIVEHDSSIGDFTHVSTRSVVNGGTTVGADCLLGSGSVVNQSLSIVGRTVIAAGAVVVKSVSDPGLYMGVPALRKRTI